MTLFAVIAVLPLKVHAGGRPESTQSQNQYQRQGQSQKAISGSHSASKSDSRAYSGSSSNAQSLSSGVGIGGNNSTEVSNSATSGASSAILTVNEAEPENDLTIRNTPNMSIGGLYPANPCHKAIQAGLSFPGVGASGGTMVVDPVCQQLEWTRMAYHLGLRDAALHSLCSMEQAKGNPHCITDNQWQDYNLEMGAVKDTVKIMQGQLDESHGREALKDRRIASLEEALKRANDKIVCQVEEACGK